MTPPHFRHFAAIDWSGAQGARHAGIAVASCAAAGGPPVLISPPAGPGTPWSRGEVLSWVIGGAPEATLIGFDMGISLAFADAGAFFPGWAQSPATARGLWALVEHICAEEEHLGVSAFVHHPEARRYFRRPRRFQAGQEDAGGEGDRFAYPGSSNGRLRVTEHQQAQSGARPTSNFNLVGASQVGKASLAGMRLLHRLPRAIPVWPIDPLPQAPGKVVVEIYTALAALAAGRRAGRAKIRDWGALDVALAMLGSPSLMPAGAGRLSDHAGDALLTAAWLRASARDADLWRALWQPALLTPRLAITEGWTFGAR